MTRLHTFFRRHRRRHPDGDDIKEITVSVELPANEKTTLRSNVRDKDGLLDSAAKVTWTLDTTDFATITDNGDGTATVVGVAEGVAEATATATDTDGNVKTSDPFEVDVVAVVAGDAATVIVTADPPVAQ